MSRSFCSFLHAENDAQPLDLGDTHECPIFGQTHISRITNIKAEQVKQFLLAPDSVPLEPTTVGVTLSRIGTKVLEYLYPWQPYTPATRLNFVVLGLKSELQGFIAHDVSQLRVFRPFRMLPGLLSLLQNIAEL